MEFQREYIRQELTNHGWSITSTELQPAWWADEIWQLESNWSKVGTHAFVCFLVDPQNDDPDRKKGNYVWAVTASTERPADRLDPEDKHLISLGSGWRTELSGFFAYLDNIRK